ncbi:dihydroorotate dehydrogenase electron transfer subunit [Lapillicoccus jejuensis]|uniref:Dihydroorotate oxidase B electron transfer subunit n=1 Tax=Lapillicoccus jejuensis TaxID=402171 RepID=A0A542E6N7_9MICO|nr:dihydroorotate dehydrogenase electron transfer subunit [Lapillicoccus jejuensis]TQJ10926.1 dihydroorotate oxidase B electron transfer subunit [Lapillicoccus jejuensis]
MSGEVPDTPVAQVAARLLSNEPVGAYRHLVLDAAAVAAPARPGQFVAVAVGGDDTAHLLRRCFSIHRVDPAAGTVELVVADAGAGTHWLVGLRPGAAVDVVGPLGTPFPLPDEPTGCVLVGGGYGSAPLGWLAEQLRAAGSHVELVLGAATADRLFGVEAGRRTADAVSVTTDDGSAGTKGWVSDVLPEVIGRSSATTLYACGPMAMLRSVTDVAAAHRAVAHVAVEEAMACGIGICMTCVMPVVQDDGQTKMVRSCLEGPVFRGDAVRWEAFADGRCAVPADAVGAPVAAGGGGH